jgi:predicted PurR-regulated permease PerM
MIPKNEPYTYPQKVWIAGSILSLIIIILLLLNETFSVLLLVLAGSLIAIFFRGLGSFIQKRTGWKNSITIILSVLINTVIIVALVWLVGAKVQSQVTSLNEALPSSIENARAQLNKSQLGQSLVKQISSPSSLQKARSIGSTFLKSSFGVFTDIYVVIFIGIFFTASPKLYINGIIQIVPVKGRDKAMEVLNKIGGNLKKWLLGKLFAMAVVFILTAVGLLIIGSPLWIALALIAGIFNFIPNFGPLRFFVTFGELAGFKDYHSSQQFKSCLSIHSSFYIFQSVDLSFNLTIAIWRGYRVINCLKIGLYSLGKAFYK